MRSENRQVSKLTNIPILKITMVYDSPLRLQVFNPRNLPYIGSEVIRACRVERLVFVVVASSPKGTMLQKMG